MKNFSTTLSERRGISIITIAFILPILILLVLSSLEFFLYFRAVAVVQRAASEAAKALAAALPGKEGNSTANSFPKIFNKPTVRSVSGGNTFHNLERSFAEHGQFYKSPAQPNLEKSHLKKVPSSSIKLPFALSRAEHPPDPKTMDPGVQYLPFVTVWTCLEPNNESAHDLLHCHDNEHPHSRQGFLTYQLPSMLDFDGDGHEDLVFFSQNGAHGYWWIIPSSGGTLFRYSISFDQEISDLASETTLRVLPCPADYDGDEKTDFCIAALRQNTIELDVRFSSQLYTIRHSFQLRDVTAGLILPVPGRFGEGNLDSFTAILLESALESNSQKSNFATYLWPPFMKKEERTALQTIFTIEDHPLKLDEANNKPSPGRNWRPAFGDHDGDGKTDLGWLTWAGGYLTARLAGEAVGLEKRETPLPASTAQMSPWGLFYPRSKDAAGLYVVERSNHRISLITPGNDGKLNGRGDEEGYVLIAGKIATTTDSTLFEPDPLNHGALGVTFVPTTSGQNSCPTCYPGGSYSGDSGDPKNAGLNTPTAVYSSGLGPFFIADYGNMRVRKIEPGAERRVNGSSGEVITTIAGGTVAPGVQCPGLADEITPGPKSGEASLPWDTYGTQAQAQGIHPSCVAVRPLSLEMDTTTQAFFIGDEMGVIFVVFPGNDGVMNASPDEKMTVLAGAYRQWSENPIKTGHLGFPSALAFYEDKVQGNRLIVVSRSNGIPSTKRSSEKLSQESSGGIFQITARDGSFGFTRAGQTTGGILAALAGTWKSTNKAPGLFGDALSSPQGDLLNPTGIVLYHDHIGDSENSFGAFITGWWADSKNNSWENSLIHLYSQGSRTLKFAGGNRDTILPLATFQWLNNIHANSWGVQPPRSSPETFAISAFNALPLATLPVEPSAGVALSPDNHYLYFSQTRLGQIMVVTLDEDGDGKHDLPSEDRQSVRDNDQDSDRDGDGIQDVEDEFPFVPQLTISKQDSPVSPHSKRESFRRMEIFQDAVLWAASTTGSIDANGVAVDRLEWWLDRFAAVDKVPYSPNLSIAPNDQPPFTLLNRHTIIVPSPREALHSTPVWPGGIDRSSEKNLATGKFRLAPLILASKAPSEHQVKEVSGYDQCSDWSLDEDATEESGGLLSTGEPQSVCGRNLNQLLSDGKRVGIRRAHLSHWANQWYPFSPAPAEENELGFIDWDGDGQRNPAFFASGVGNKRISEEESKNVTSSRPLMVYIGNLKGEADRSNSSACPGEFAISELNALWPVLQTQFSPPLTAAEKQYECATAQHFFSSQSVPYVAIMADAHAEWTTTNLVFFSDFPAEPGNRLQVASTSENTAAAGESPGPVAETAYQILERSLRVKHRGSLSEPFDAQVDILVKPNEKSSHASVIVQYVWPMNRFLAKLLGKKSVIIKQSVTRRVY